MQADTATLDRQTTATAEISQNELRQKIFEMIWPVTAESVLQMMVGMVGSAMVGRLGATAVGAVGLSSRVTQLSWALFFGVATGATVLVARSLGAGNQAAARHTARQALSTSISLVSILTLLSFFFARPFLIALNADAELLSASMKYLGIALWSLPLVAVMQTVSGILRGAGNTKTPMQVAIIVNIINLFLNWIFIFGKLGFPALGIRGSAWAALISQGCGAAMGLYVLYSPLGKIHLNWKERIGLDWREVKRVLQVGVPSSAEHLFWQMATIILTSLIVSFGKIPLAAHQQGLQAESLSYMPAAGFGIAATAFVGQSLGAGNLALAKRYIRQIAIWGLYLTCITAGILFFVPGAVMSILTNDQQVITLGSKYLMLMAVAQFPQQVSGVLNGALRGAGDTAAPMVVAGIGMWLIRIPLSFYLGRTLGLGIIGVWLAMTIDLFIRFVLSYARFHQGRWQNKQL